MSHLQQSTILILVLASCVLFKVLSLSLALENKWFKNMLYFLHLPLLAVIIFFLH